MPGPITQINDTETLVRFLSILSSPKTSYLAFLKSLWFPKHALHLIVPVGFLYLGLRIPPTLAIENLAILNAQP